MNTASSTASIGQSGSGTASKATSQRSSRVLHWLPTVLFLLAALLLVISITRPYWGMVLKAPQYPGGLEVRVYVNQMTGDDDLRRDEVKEIDGLNHYIGMKSLLEAAKIERSISMVAVLLMAALLVVVAFWRARFAWLLSVPAIAFPFVFLGDLAFWLSYYGQNLDPDAPLSSSIKPFTPPIFGEGVIGQFKTIGYVSPGWFLAVGATLCVVVALVLRLRERRRATAQG